MIKQFLLHFLRKIKRDKSTFLINLFGLSIGLTSAFLMYLWVNDELSIDKFHENDSRLYQVMQNFEMPDGIETWNYTPALLASEIKKKIPEIDLAVSVKTSYIDLSGIISTPQKKLEVDGTFTSEDYFNLFSYKLLQGDKENVLKKKNAVLLSESLAIKLFGNTNDLLGKTITWTEQPFDGAYEITGVFEDNPKKSTARYDFIFNFQLVPEKMDWAARWSGDAAVTYITLNKDANIENVNKKLTHIIKNTADREEATLFLQKYSDRYLHGKYEDGKIIGGRIEYVRLFSVIAILVLIIACINYMNLSTAKAIGKMMEVGIKKAIGSKRNTLTIQFLCESMLLSLLAVTFAIGLSSLLLPVFNNITGKHLEIIFNSKILIALISITLLTGLVSGSYPAIYISGFNPATILKGGKIKTSFSEIWMRKALVVIQFSLSIILVIGFLVVNKQINFIQNKSLGFKKENIICFERKGFFQQNNHVFKDELMKIPGVLNATYIDGEFLNNNRRGINYKWPGMTPDQEIVIPCPTVGTGFFETMNIELVEGELFSNSNKITNNGLIINETAVKWMGFDNPIGQAIIGYGGRTLKVIGVVKDFHILSAHEKIEPCIISNVNYGRNFLVKVEAGMEKEVLKKLNKIYEKVHTDYPFEYSFLDNDYQLLYESEARVASLSKYFAAIAILLSCLGLFGLSAFTAQKRIKEIGVRKVIGSTQLEVISLLTGHFTVLVFLAISLSIPISIIIVKTWLNRFAYTIDLHWWFFLGSGLAAMLISLATVSIHAFKASVMNPVKALRYE